MSELGLVHDSLVASDRSFLQIMKSAVQRLDSIVEQTGILATEKLDGLERKLERIEQLISSAEQSTSQPRAGR